MASQKLPNGSLEVSGGPLGAGALGKLPLVSFSLCTFSHTGSVRAAERPPATQRGWRGVATYSAGSLPLVLVKMSSFATRSSTSWTPSLTLVAPRDGLCVESSHGFHTLGSAEAAWRIFG